MQPTSGKVELDFVTQVGSLPQASLIRFYEILAHNLTVSIRSIWSNETLSDAQKVERMKWINEIMHRVVTKSAALRKNKNEYSEADFWGMMEHYMSLCPEITDEVVFATIGSYSTVESPGDAV